MTNTNTAAKKTLTTTEFAAALAWNVKNIAGRLAALELCTACGRCGGSGRYSYNQMTGDRCFGCNGAGKVLPKLTTGLVEQVKGLVAAGKLDAYLARSAEILAARAAIKPLLAEIEATYEPIGAAYEAAYQAKYRSENPVEMPEAICLLQKLANAIRWTQTGGRYRREDPAFFGASEIKMSLDKIPAPVAVKVLTERLEQIKVCAAALATLQGVLAALKEGQRIFFPPAFFFFLDGLKRKA